MKHIKGNYYCEIQFIPVKKTELHKKTLFQLFKRRDNEAKISADHQLNYDEHAKFVDNNPYRYWFIIKSQQDFIGTFYIKKDNGLGVYLLPEHKDAFKSTIRLILDKFKPLPARPSERRFGFHMNISTKNENFEKSLKTLGAELMQKTYFLG